MPPADRDPDPVIATPPKGSGPGVLFLCGRPGDRPGVTAMAEQLAAEGYVTGVYPDGAGPGGAAAALDRIRGHLAHQGRCGLVAFGDAGATALDLLAQGRADCGVLFDPASPPLARAAADALDAPVTLHVAGEEHGLGAAGSEPAAEGPHPAAYLYPDQRAGFALPGAETHDPPAAGLAWSRTVAALKRTMGPHYNLEELWAYHLACEFRLKDAAETMTTMVADPYVNHVPTLTGGVGFDRLRHFYAHHFVNQVPADRRSIPISQTVGADRIVDEKIFCFTHDAPLDWLLPGVAPTGRYVEIPLVGIVTFRGDKLVNEHIYWDQASVLVQVGLLDPAGLPVAGREQAAKLRDPALPSNELMPNWQGP